MTGSSSTKGQHYADTLDLARRLSLFTSEYPAELKTGNINRRASSGMDWNELLRKFTKHNPHRTLTASTAQTDQILHRLLSQTPTMSSGADLGPLPPILPASLHPQALTAVAALEGQPRTGSPTEVENAQIVASFGRYLMGQDEQVVRTLESIDLVRSLSTGEAYDLTLRVLGFAIRGFSLEKLAYPFDQVRETYRLAAKQYDQAIDSQLTTKDDVSLFRIGDTVLSRLCRFDQLHSSPQMAHASHLLYIRHSAKYHALTASASAASGPFPFDRTLAILQEFHTLSLATNNHFDSRETTFKLQEDLLRRTTSLPKAGEVNIRYLAFLDQVVESWKARGLDKRESGSVIEILYNALTHTFQSHRLLRYLVRSLAIAERYREAHKALDLYVELWHKSKETDAKAVAREMKTLRARQTSVQDKTNKLDEKDQFEEKDVRDDDDEHDIDSDSDFIETGVIGVRILCRYLDEPKAALEIAKKLQEVVKSGATVQKDDEVRGRVELALGIAWGCLAAKEANPSERPSQHAAALSHLELATALLPKSFHAHYQLAYQLFELRQTSRALEQIKVALSFDTHNKRGWHLLGLVLTALKDPKGALQVFENAIDLEPVTSDEDRLTRDETLAKLEGNHVQAVPTCTKQDRWDYPLSETETLAQEVQLRLSKNAVVEYLEGPAAALEDQQEILSWYSRAYIPIAESLREPPFFTYRVVPTALEGGLGLGATNLSKRKSLLGRRVSLRSKRDSSVPLRPVSLSVVPPGLSPASANPTPYASAAPSLAPSIISPATPLDKPNVATNPLATKLLVDVWLACAASFRRAGKLDEAQGAVWEAEQLNADDPDVSCQLATIYLARGETTLARRALQKAFSFEIDHSASTVLFARLYLISPNSNPTTSVSSLGAKVKEVEDSTTWIDRQVPFAETLLDTLTKKQGWDSPEAWYELSRCYKLTNRREKEKECLVWALQLEETRSLRGLGNGCLDRVL
ncbi:uncharacterized protein JCM15063_002943 [Sporobolomyces koalae]|uniref:uncharacterized protein n=1 Tax=Sporobolomyces koalae TaxID=500713 RepID=UPI003173AEB7